CRQPPYAPEGGDAGVRLRDAGRRLWPCPQRPVAGAHLYEYNSGTGNWDDYTRLLNRTRPPSQRPLSSFKRTSDGGSVLSLSHSSTRRCRVLGAKRNLPLDQRTTGLTPSGHSEAFTRLAYGNH